MEEVKAIMNSPMLWVMSAVMIAVVIAETVTLFKQSWDTALEIGVPKEELSTAVKSAMYTAVGPSLSPVIVLLALMAIVGAPTAWMRMNDIGAARTEIAMAGIAAGVAGSSLEVGKLTMMGFVFVLWGAALNNMGWMIVGGFGAPILGKATDYLDANFDKTWIKMFNAAASFGLFGTLLVNNIVAKNAIKPANAFCGVVSFCCMSAISKIFAKNKTLQEFGLGISMLIGMFATAIIF